MIKKPPNVATNTIDLKSRIAHAFGVDPSELRHVKPSPQRQAQQRLFNETDRILRQALQPDAKALAEQIILAGKKRRGEIVDAGPPAGSLAEQIILAGKKRRGEIVDAGPPAGSLAEQIILAGKKRRGEI